MSNEWVMVPREPTEAMFSASSFQEWDTFEQEWRAMLYAAPAAPQQAEPVAWRRDAKLQQVRPYYVYRDVQRDGDSREAWEPLYLHPPPAEVQRMAIDLNRLRVAARAVTDAVYDRERLFAVTELRAALDALEGGE